ncbi:MAG: HyaD/HybD family hydrogenase maturation endopeptidase [Candidatus Desulfofervidaceae bacterium]|nr:HyaD/HybD family hydrogenase maturation endopeptidase [Candidatus Desulfofervidaceae bacterium]
MKIMVLGIGNILMKDEGVGVRTVEHMKKLDLPKEVELMDGGTSTPLLFPYFTEVDHLIVIDAVKGNMPPGSIYRLKPEDLLPPDDSPVSLHDLGLVNALQMAEQVGMHPKTVIIFGVEPKEIDWGMELTPEIERRIPTIAQIVLDEINKLINLV